MLHYGRGDVKQAESLYRRILDKVWFSLGYSLGFKVRVERGDVKLLSLGILDKVCRV
jgi:hypothetical protein